MWISKDEYYYYQRVIEKNNSLEHECLNYKIKYEKLKHKYIFFINEYIKTGNNYKVCFIFNQSNSIYNFIKIKSKCADCFCYVDIKTKEETRTTIEKFADEIISICLLTK